MSQLAALFQPAASLYLQVNGLCALTGARNKPATGSYRVVACAGSVQHSCNCKIDQINTFILYTCAVKGLKYLVHNHISALYRTATTKISRCERVRLANAKSVFRVFLGTCCGAVTGLLHPVDAIAIRTVYTNIQ